MLSFFFFAFQNSPESIGVRTTKNEDENEKEKELQLESLLGAFESLGKAWPRSAETQRKQQKLHFKKGCCSQELRHKSRGILCDDLRLQFPVEPD